MTGLETDNLELRKLLWLKHGCPHGILYGDDGEMQCNNVEKHMPVDFKRDTPLDIKTKLFPEQTAVADIIAFNLKRGQTVSVPCDECSGAGVFGEEACEYCEGTGRVTPS